MLCQIRSGYIYVRLRQDVSGYDMLIQVWSDYDRICKVRTR